MSGLRTALRIARRDAWRHKGRSLLVMTMIALPVLAGVTGDVLIRTGQATPAEQAQAQLADADAWIIAPNGDGKFSQFWTSYSSGGLTINGQLVTSVGDESSDGGDTNQLPAKPASQVLPLLPAGSQITPWQHAAAVPMKTRTGTYISVTADLLDMTSPAAGGRYHVIQGAAPTTPGQVALTNHLAERLHLKVGATITAGAPERTYTVVGIVDAAATGTLSVAPGEFDALVALPNAVPYTIDRLLDDFEPRYLVTTPEPITLRGVYRLNDEGIGVYSRAVVTDPAAMAEVNPSGPSALLIGGLIIGIVMAIVQVIFLAGPAFAISARRMRRQFGQLTAAGAQPGHLRAVVLSSGLVLGMAGSLLGLGVGVGISALAYTLFPHAIPGFPAPGLHLHPAELLGIAALGVATAVLAALAPAISTGRATALSLLSRQPASPRGIRWWSVAGAVLATAGAALTIAMATGSLPVSPPESTIRTRGVGLAAGAVMVEIGLLLAIPLVVHLLARVGAALPTAGRLALRDADRHRSRTAPAIAAVTAAVTFAVIASVIMGGAGKGAEAHYRPGLPVGDVALTIENPIGPGGGVGNPMGTPGSTDTLDVADATATITGQWPHSSTTPFSVIRAQQEFPAKVTAPDPVDNTTTRRAWLIPVANLCPFTEPGESSASLHYDSETAVAATYSPTNPTPADIESASTDWRCVDRSYSTLTPAQAHTSDVGIRDFIISNVNMPAILVGGPELRHQLTSIDDPAADAALSRGAAVVLDRTYLTPDGTISSGMVAHDSQTDTPEPTDIRYVPAVLGRSSPTPLGVILSPQAAQRLGWTVSTGGMVIDPGQPVTQQEAQTVALAVQATTGVPVRASLETGSLDNVGARNLQRALTIILIIIALLIAATVIVVTALGLADSRPDLATLAAVGAPPRIRRLLTGWAALLVTFLGCLLGGAVGLVPAWGMLRLTQVLGSRDPIIVPWAPLVALLITVPLLAFAIGTLLPRSRLPMIARTE